MHPNELRHLQLQAAIRDAEIPESELKYLGRVDGEHTYLIAGEHIVPVSHIEGFDEVSNA